MPNGAQDIETYGFQTADRLLVDANVLLLVHGPQRPGDNRVAIYSSAWKRMLQAQCSIHVDVLIMSEFINRYARLRHKQLGRSVSGDFKRFRNSASFRTVAAAIADAARRILMHAKRTACVFEEMDVLGLLVEYEKGKLDFNDQVVAETCKRNELRLVTDDRDFRQWDLSLLTANRKLLRSRRA
jgi:predicted nucleic acid-binding protein